MPLSSEFRPSAIDFCRKYSNGTRKTKMGEKKIIIKCRGYIFPINIFLSHSQAVFGGCFLLGLEWCKRNSSRERAIAEAHSIPSNLLFLEKPSFPFFCYFCWPLFLLENLRKFWRVEVISMN